MHRQARGFTLVEVLVVVSIIVILVGILVPSLERAMAASQRGRCAANLKGIGTALGTYLNDSLARVYPKTQKWYGLFGQLGEAAGYNTKNDNTTTDADSDGIMDAYDADTNQDVLGRPLNPYLGITGQGGEVKIAECPSDAGGTTVLDSDNNDVMEATSSNVFRSTGSSYIDAFGAFRTGIQGAFGANPMQAAAAKPASSKILVGDAPLYGENKYAADRKNRWHQSNKARREYNILYADYRAELFQFPRTDEPTHPDNIERTTAWNNDGTDINPSRGFW